MGIKLFKNPLVLKGLDEERLDEEIPRAPESLRDTEDPSKQPRLCWSSWHCWKNEINKFPLIFQFPPSPFYPQLSFFWFMIIGFCLFFGYYPSHTVDPLLFLSIFSVNHSPFFYDLNKICNSQGFCLFDHFGEQQTLVKVGDISELLGGDFRAWYG